ncbi:MAG: hypothetical protein Rubg2KO_12930 [Rubricoccaceae bacterium]
MLTIQTIVFPTDESEIAEAARSVAEQAAERYGAELHVLRVEIIPPAGDLRYDAIPEPFEVESPDTETGVIEVRRRHPVAADAIVDYADEVDADLVVMGTHGRSGINRLTLGSTAERVLRLAPCPVLTIGPDADTEATGPVLVPLVFESASDAALETALALAESRGTRLVAVHVIEPIDIPPPYGLVVAGFNPVELKDRVRQTVERWVAAYAESPVPIEVDIREGSASVQIVEAARAYGASLIVQSSHGRRGLSRWLLGSVAEAVARRASCPTLTLRLGARGLTQSDTEMLPVPRKDWAELFDALSKRIASSPHAVSVDVVSPEAEGPVYDAVPMLGVTYYAHDDSIEIMTESGGHTVAHPFAIRSTIGGWALDAARDASAPGPWSLEIVRDDGMRERVTFWETAAEERVS